MEIAQPTFAIKLHQQCSDLYPLHCIIGNSFVLDMNKNLLQNNLIGYDDDNAVERFANFSMLQFGTYYGLLQPLHDRPDGRRKSL